MSQRPNHLPETPPQRKRKNDEPPSAPSASGGWLRGCALLSLGLLLGLSIGAVVIFALFQPGWFDLFGVEATASALAGSAVALDETQQSQQQQDIDFQLTQAALNNERALIDQTLTQSARDAGATRTAVAVSNSRQQTQIALDYAGTQAALNRSATQVELDFEATRSAVSQDATAISGDQSAAVVPTATPTPSPYNANGLDLNRWTFNAGNWDVSGARLTALTEPSWIISQAMMPSNYRVELIFEPAGATMVDILLLRETSNDHVLVRLAGNGARFDQAGVYRWARAEADSAGLYQAAPEMILALPVDLPVSESLSLVVVVEGQSIQLLTGDTELLSTTLDSATGGPVGVQISAGARITQLQARPLP